MKRCSTANMSDALASKIDKIVLCARMWEKGKGLRSREGIHCSRSYLHAKYALPYVTVHVGINYSRNLSCILIAHQHLIGWRLTMDSTFPYTLYSCPCSNSSSLAARQQRRTSLGVNQIEYEDEEQTFNPHSPIANYSLYPLEHLLYCEECREIRCWNCSFEEVSTWFCPSCLFEFGSSMVKTEGNR